MMTIVLAVGLVAALGSLVAVAILAARRSRREAARYTEVAERATDLERDQWIADSILSSLQDGVALVDRKSRAVYRNDLAAGSFASIVDPASMPANLMETIARVTAARASEVVEVEDPGGRVIAVSVAPAAGDRLVLLVLRDISATRMQDAVRRDFVANASHELKTPAAAIQALAETIQQALAEDQAALPSFSAQLSREAERLSRIIADLLDLSRLESEAGRRSDLRLDRLVTEEADRLGPRAQRAGLGFDVQTNGRVTIHGSPRDVSLLVRNLIENAIQYTRPGGQVAVRVAAEDGAAVLEVRDSGIGIPSRDQARVFERFYRVDRARSRETGGTGLGLSIVKHVVANHGGTVGVASRLGRGSTFTVRLPLADPEGS